MKRKKLIALCTLLNLAFAPVALADPVELSGELSMKHQRDHTDGESAEHGTVLTLTMDAKAKVSENVFLYTRLGAQNVSNTKLADFISPPYSSDKKTVVALDQFGVIWNQDEVAYKLGRQDVTVGSTALLYSKPSSNIGKNAFADGLSINSTVGSTEIAAFFGKEDNYDTANNQLYAMRAAYSPNNTWTYGATLARYNNKEADESTNHWAIDSTYKYGKHNLTAEFTESSINRLNKAYAAAWNYDFDDKVAASITGFRVEEKADMGGNSDFDNGNRGIHYGITYKIDDALSFEGIYKDQKEISSGLKNNSTELTLHYTF